MISYGRFGLFLVQCVNMALVLFLANRVFETGYSNLSYLKKYILLIPILLFMIPTLGGGNLTEEFSLLPLVLAILWLTRYLKQCYNCENYKNSIWIAFGYGAMFGFFLFLRVNNSALLLAIVFIVSINILIHKEFINLLQNALMFICGFIISLIPVFVFAGVNNMIPEMLHAMFYLGFKYSGEMTIWQHLCVYSEKWYYTLISFVPIMITLVFWRFYKKEKMYMVLAVLGCLVTNLACLTGNNYIHYYALNIPLLIYGEFLLVTPQNLILEYKTNRKQLIAFGLIAVAIALYASDAIGTVKFSAVQFRNIINNNFEDKDYVDIASYIPNNEKDSVYTYGIPSRWYLYNGIFPYCRYCDWQDHYISLMPEIKNEIVEMFENNPPKYLVLKTDKASTAPFIRAICDEKYIAKESNSTLTLYTLAPKEII